MQSQVDFGYLWPWTHGHLIVAAVALPLCLISRWRRWRWLWTAASGVVLIWSLASFLIVHYVLGIDQRMALPTQSFLRGGPARVIDLGAGSGRSTLMVLEARPQATVVAL